MAAGKHNRMDTVGARTPVDSIRHLGPASAAGVLDTWDLAATPVIPHRVSTRKPRLAGGTRGSTEAHGISAKAAPPGRAAAVSSAPSGPPSFFLKLGFIKLEYFKHVVIHDASSGRARIVGQHLNSAVDVALAVPRVDNEGQSRRGAAAS